MNWTHTHAFKPKRVNSRARIGKLSDFGSDYATLTRRTITTETADGEVSQWALPSRVRVSQYFHSVFWAHSARDNARCLWARRLIIDFREFLRLVESAFRFNFRWIAIELWSIMSWLRLIELKSIDYAIEFETIKFSDKRQTHKRLKSPLISKQTTTRCRMM